MPGNAPPIPKGFAKLPVGELLTAIESYVDLRIGAGATSEQIDALEREHGLTFPPDYRDFVARFGQLDILDRDATVRLQVFGLHNLSAARQNFRTLFAEWGCTDDWLEDDDEEREPLRAPYREMVPVISAPDSEHHATACLAPDQLTYVVSVKAWEVDEPRSFSEELAAFVEAAVYRMHANGKLLRRN